MTKEKLWEAVSRSGGLLGIGAAFLWLGIDVILEPNYYDYRFGHLRFGDFGYLVGGAFAAFGAVALGGGLVNALKVLRQK